MAEDAEPDCSQHIGGASESQPEQGTAETLPDPPAAAPGTSNSPGPTIFKLLRGKETEWEAIKKKTGPLQLLDLPVDVLRLVVKELTYANDLTALALANSTLYNLAVPKLYAQFDIIWPVQPQTASADSSRVDALTYGLSTLCLGSKFAQRSRWIRGTKDAASNPPRRVIDNQYAKFTRKFEISNGQKQWFQEYMIAKEGGKMLGTLVALAVARMVNLETFVWDMPTGVLSDVFMSLASAQDHHAEGETTLQNVWIRCPDCTESDGSSTSSSSPAQSIHSIPQDAGASSEGEQTTTGFGDLEEEYPTFSVLPPLKRLAVLDIEAAITLDEISLLIERSRDGLRELRLGVSKKARDHNDAFTQSGDEPNLQQTDHDASWPGASQVGDKRLGGPLGAALSRVYDIRTPVPPKTPEGGVVPGGNPASATAANQVMGTASSTAPSHAGATVEEPNADPSSDSAGSEATGARENSQGCRKRLVGKLRLDTLELERIDLHVSLCVKAFDWSILTSLTILGCPGNQAFWQALGRQFQPTPAPYGSPPGTPPQFHLVLKNLYTDCTSESFVTFVKETLEPNSLETLFLLHEGGDTPMPVEKLFNGIVKKHRRSLKKLMIDSSCKTHPHRPSTFRPWMMTNDMVSYLTSGKMKNLRELSIAIDLRDWHSFLQRLPSITELRSLHIHHAKRHHINFDTVQIAAHAGDVVSLRPDLKLCFVAVEGRCYEITEEGVMLDEIYNHAETGVSANGATFVPEIDDSSSSSEEDNNGDDHSNIIDADDDGANVSSEAESDAETQRQGLDGKAPVRLRLREILFYDKVDIFKAKSGRL